MTRPDSDWIWIQKEDQTHLPEDCRVVLELHGLLLWRRWQTILPRIWCQGCPRQVNGLVLEVAYSPSSLWCDVGRTKQVRSGHHRKGVHWIMQYKYFVKLFALFFWYLGIQKTYGSFVLLVYIPIMWSMKNTATESTRPSKLLWDNLLKLNWWNNFLKDEINITDMLWWLEVKTYNEWIGYI